MSSAAHPQDLVARRPFALPGWGITVIALVIFLAAVGAGIVIGQNTATQEAVPAAEAAQGAQAVPIGSVPGLASPEDTAMIDDHMAAWSSGDGRDAASYFTEDAVIVNDIGGYTLSGSQQIAREAGREGAGGVLLRRDTAVIDANGEFLSAGFNYSSGYGIAVYRMTSDPQRGRLIAEMWVYGY